MNDKPKNRARRVLIGCAIPFAVLCAFLLVVTALRWSRAQLQEQQRREQQRREQQARVDRAAEERVAREQARVDSLVRSAAASTVRGFDDRDLDVAERRAAQVLNTNAYTLLHAERLRRSEAVAAKAAAGRVDDILARARAEKAGVSRSRIEQLLREHPYWSEDVIALVAAGSFTIGMTAEQLTEAWGRPRDVNRTVGAWGTHEQWVYGHFLHPVYVYLEDGVITSWQD
jgi:hypothetical protein